MRPSILDHKIDEVKKTPITGNKINSINIKNRNKLTEVVDLKRKIRIKKNIENIEKPIKRDDINPNGLKRYAIWTKKIKEFSVYEKKLLLVVFEFLMYLNMSESVRIVVIDNKTESKMAKDIIEWM